MEKSKYRNCPLCDNNTGKLFSIVENVPKIDVLKVEKAKLEIQQAFEEYGQATDRIIKEFTHKSEFLVNKYIARGLVYEGDFIQSQKDLSIETKKDYKYKY